MDTEKILAHCDHTLLKQESTWEQIREVCDDGLKYRCASVCIPASYVRRAAEHVGNALKICTVIGFPNGYSTTAVKVFETEDAIRNGADEIDMVINIGWVKDRRWEDLLTEIKAVKASCQGRILKVIVEACLLTGGGEDQDVARSSPPRARNISRPLPAFPPGGATREDVALFARHIGSGVKIKAAGGISTLQDAEDFLALGADRLGTSRIVKLVKGQQGEGY